MTAPVSPFKVASVLLQYPTMALFDGLGQLAEAVREGPRATQRPFGIFLEWLSGTSPDTVARHYVETFELPGGRGGSSPRRRQSRCVLYLTYYRYGDTRKRGMAMVTFKAAYRAAGLEPAQGEGAGGELPDYLPMVLDFAGSHPRGEKLLRAHRADLELLLRALRDVPSPYAHVVEAVCARLPALRRPDEALVRRFWESGPPAEEVGLEPFAPPSYLEAPR